MKDNKALALQESTEKDHNHGQITQISGPSVFWFPVYEGIFEHAPVLKDAVWLFMWLINRTTIFSGLLKCGLCGANVTIVSGRWKGRVDAVYGCPLNANRGDVVCRNEIRIGRLELETQLLAGLQAKVLHPEVVEYTMEKFEATLTEQLAGLDHEMDRMSRRKAVLDREIRNLTNRIAGGDPSPSIMAAIAERERELQTIADRLLESRPDSIRSRFKDIRRFVETRLRDLRGLLNSEPVTVRMELAKHVSRIVLIPEGKSYKARTTWDLIGIGSMDGAGGES